MQKIKLLENYKEHKKGDIIEEKNNIVFGLIDKNKAKLFVGIKKRKDTMLRKSGVILKKYKK